MKTLVFKGKDAIREYAVKVAPELADDPEGLSWCVDTLVVIGEWGKHMQRKGIIQGAVAASVGITAVMVWRGLKPMTKKNSLEK